MVKIEQALTGPCVVMNDQLKTANKMQTLRPFYIDTQRLQNDVGRLKKELIVNKNQVVPYKLQLCCSVLYISLLEMCLIV